LSLCFTSVTPGRRTLCLIKHHATKTYWGMEENLHAFLTCALDGVSDHFTSRPLYTPPLVIRRCNINKARSSWAHDLRCYVRTHPVNCISLLAASNNLQFKLSLGPIQWVTGAVSLGVKPPVRKADYSPPSSSKVKKAWSSTSSPPIRLHGMVLS
jgi:hypothetical protein